MRGVNKVIIVGNLGADPEIRQFPNGGMVANISVATSESWTDKQTGEKKEATEWHRIQFSNRLAEIAQQYLRKGSSVYIEGSLKTRKWQDQNGQDRYTTEIRASNMQMLGANPNAAMGGQMNSPMGGNAPMGMGQPNQMGGYQNQNNQAGGFQNQQNGFQNQPNSFNAPQQNVQQASAPPAQQPFQQQAPQAPTQSANPQGMAMQDAPADDDIPF